jgi:hypothetical protein
VFVAMEAGKQAIANRGLDSSIDMNIVNKA